MSEPTMKQRAVRAVLAAVDKGPSNDWPLEDFTDSSGRKAIGMVNEDSIRVLNVSETVDIVLTAALEGEPLYRRVDECTECAYAGDDGDVMCYLGLPHDWFVQVNQEGEQR